jgi:hypothetical protein
MLVPYYKEILQSAQHPIGANVYYIRGCLFWIFAVNLRMVALRGPLQLEMKLLLMISVYGCVSD